MEAPNYERLEQAWPAALDSLAAFIQLNGRMPTWLETWIDCKGMPLNVGKWLSRQRRRLVVHGDTCAAVQAQRSENHSLRFYHTPLTAEQLQQLDARAPGWRVTQRGAT
jgi:hypothetical protein